MLLNGPWPKLVLGILAPMVLAAIALFQINEWWPACNFVRGWHHSEPAGEPLIVAAAKGGCTGCIRTLLRHGADPNIVSDVYVTPLVAAVQYGHYRTARLLLQHGAQVNVGAGSGRALCQALMSENPDGGMIELLLTSGATLQWTGDAEQPAFSAFDCLHHSDFGPTHSEEAKRFAHLIDHGLVETFSELPEHRQAELLRFLYDDEIKQLARHGAKLDLNLRDSKGNTIISLVPGICDRIRLLVSEGAQYAAQDADVVKRCNN